LKNHEIKISNFNIIFEPKAEGGYKVVVPAIPEIRVYGETLKEAKTLAKEAVERYIDALESNEPVPNNPGRVFDEFKANLERNSQVGPPR
jgi:predicted RNase H-like HicB family nuclease